MRANFIIAILLIAAGAAALLYQGVTYKTREKVVDLGPVQVTADRTRTLPISPILGGLALLGGIGILVLAKQKD